MNRDYMDFARDDYDRAMLETYLETNSQRKTAERMCCGKSTVQRTLAFLKNAYEDFHGIHAPEGYAVKGTSTLYDDQGNKKLQWVKTNISAEKQIEAMRAAVEAMKETIEPCEPELPLEMPRNDDILNLYLITDYHLGMKAWKEETGGNWDLAIAEGLLLRWFQDAILRAPDSRDAVFAQLGDFLHWDDAAAPVTPAHGNVLDGDSRTQKVVRTAIRVLRKVTSLLLKKHENVHLIMAEGNHDPASSIWLREMFSALYDNEPRITVELSPDPYYCYEFGKTSLFFHHGHKRRITNIDTVFAAKFREVFGRTQYSYGHMGHLHSTQVRESNLMKITQWQTLASPDAYASRGGWMSGRSAPVITYHKEFGRVGELSITPEMVA